VNNFFYLQRPGIYEGVKTIPKKNKDAVREVLQTLNEFINGNKYIAGNILTIADFSILTTVTSFSVSFDFSNCFKFELKSFSFLGNGI
jgi:glutathionyl-hydroquinone reductase